MDKVRFDRNPEATQFAVRVTTTAVKIARDVQQELVQSALVKPDQSPVTVADFAIQVIVAGALEAAFPEDLLVAEEDSRVLRDPVNQPTLDAVLEFASRVDPTLHRERVLELIDRGTAAPQSRFWVLDPVDGTKGFVRGGQYVTALGLVEDGEVILGALGCPRLGPHGQLTGERTGAVFLASRGEGAWSMELEGATWERLHVSEQRDISQARYLRSFEATHTDVGQVEEIAKVMGIGTKPIPLDSQAKFAILASGGAEVLLRIPRKDQPHSGLKIWDYAAGSILVEEAGGVVSDLRGNPLDFGRGRELSENHGIFVSTEILYPEILKGIRMLDISP